MSKTSVFEFSEMFSWWEAERQHRNQVNNMSFFPYITWAVFKLNYSASDSADKNGVKNRLKKFISRRPSMKTLQEKGLIKGEAQKT